MFDVILKLSLVLILISACKSDPDMKRDLEAYHKSPTLEEMKADPEWCNVRKKDLTPTKYDGIDVSHHNGNINWKQVAQNKNIKYVYIKATEGKNFVDPKYKQNLSGARKNNLKVGSYLFYRGGVSAQKQWDLFNRTVNKSQQDLVPMIDVEWGAFKKPLKDVIPEIRIIVQSAYDKYKKWPLIYCDDDWFDEMHSYFPNCPIMVQNFIKHLPHDLETPDVKNQNYTIWQFSELGKIKGITKPVDLSKLHDTSSLSKIIL